MVLEFLEEEHSIHLNLITFFKNFFSLRYKYFLREFNCFDFRHKGSIWTVIHLNWDISRKLFVASALPWPASS